MLGLLGAGVAEFLAVLPYRKRKLKDWPGWSKRWGYWVFAIVLVPLGGALAYFLTSDRDVSLYLAFHTGLAGPLLLERLIANAPDLSAGKVS
jgi:hypothetical protein